MPVTNYIYDGNQYLAEAEENDDITRLYTNEPDAYTHLISQEDVGIGDAWYYHYDAIGSTREVTDDAGTITDEFTYDAWGNRLSRSGTTENPFQYVGEHGYYRDERVHTYYVMARFYNPNIARWLSTDPWNLWGTIHAYVYAQLLPNYLYDPSGLYCVAPSPCEATLQNPTGESIPNLIKCIEKEGCNLDTACDKCEGIPAAGYTCVGNNLDIVLRVCENSNTKPGTTYHHELIHALATCRMLNRLKNDKNEEDIKKGKLPRWSAGCLGCVVEEFIAYRCSGECSTFDKCLDLALGSCSGGGKASAPHPKDHPCSDKVLDPAGQKCTERQSKLLKIRRSEAYKKLKESIVNAFQNEPTLCNKYENCETKELPAPPEITFNISR
jgi:RHS repeat-associated protein